MVSSQAADWDAAKAKAITQTVLKQNPDLCGIVGFWDGMDIGTAAAIREAGLTGKVFLVDLGRRRTEAAPATRSRTALRPERELQRRRRRPRRSGHDQMADVSGVKPGSVKGTVYTTLIPSPRRTPSATPAGMSAISRSSLAR